MLEDVGTEAGREKRRVIAVVEDDARLVEMFSNILAFSGQWQLHTFTDGESALDEIPTLGVDLIILDVGLPNLDGASLYKMLRGHSHTRTTPIIVITGGNCIAWAYKQDFFCKNHLAKPIC